MASRTVSVKISGPALSLLLYENINSGNGQEGFLLGNVSTIVTTSVTDASREEVKIRDVINITGVLPCDLPNKFYRANGELVEDALNDLLGQQKNNVLAWFTYKRYRKLGINFTLREKVLHDELRRFFNISPHLFTCCVLTSITSENKATQVFSHAFVNMHNSQLQMMAMHVENLGDPCHNYQENAKPSQAFMGLYKKINKNQTNLQLGLDIHNTLQNELKKSVSDLASSEQKVSQLRAEVRNLANQLRKAELLTLCFEDKSNVLEYTHIEVEAPLTPEKSDSVKNETNIIEILESGPEVEELEQTVTLEIPKVVDLTISDEEEKPPRKARNQRNKSNKSKRGTRNS